MISSSRRGRSFFGAIMPSARRSRGSACPPLLEVLEGRVLLSKGSGDSGHGAAAAQILAGGPAASFPKAQVVPIKVETLLAEGIPVPATPGGIQDGQVQVLRFDQY